MEEEAEEHEEWLRKYKKWIKDISHGAIITEDEAAGLYAICEIVGAPREKVAKAILMLEEYWEKNSYMAPHTLRRYLLAKSVYESHVEWNKSWINRMKRRIGKRIFKNRSYPPEQPIIESSIRCPPEVINILETLKIEVV